MIAHPTDDLAAYAIGALDGVEARAVGAHLDTCPTCRADARALSETAWTIAETAGKDAPGHVRAAILARARGGDAREGFWRSLLATLRRPVPFALPLALASILVIALIGYGSARRDADRYAAAVANAVGARVVPLAATAANGARGSVVVPVNGAAPYLILDLPPAASGKTWEAWVIRGDAPIRAGTTDDHGLVTLVLTAPLAAGDTIAVTAEPAGGVDAPTGVPVLAGKS